MPRPETLDALAEALDVDPAYFLVPQPTGRAEDADPFGAAGVSSRDESLAARVEEIADAVTKLVEAQQVIAQMAREDRELLREVAQAVLPTSRQAL